MAVTGHIIQKFSVLFAKRKLAWKKYTNVGRDDRDKYQLWLTFVNLCNNKTESLGRPRSFSQRQQMGRGASESGEPLNKQTSQDLASCLVHWAFYNVHVKTPPLALSIVHIVSRLCKPARLKRRRLCSSARRPTLRVLVPCSLPTLFFLARFHQRFGVRGNKSRAGPAAKPLSCFYSHVIEVIWPFRWSCPPTSLEVWGPSLLTTIQLLSHSTSSYPLPLSILSVRTSILNVRCN